MSQTDREAFLADLHVGVLSVERPGDRAPLVTPVWYRYDPGALVRINTETASQKAALLRAAGRASLCVQREEVPYAYVTVEGPVELAPATRGFSLELAVHYLGQELGAAYVEQMSSDDVTVTLTPERWFSVDYSSLEIG